jgi:hypothetical protein
VWHHAFLCADELVLFEDHTIGNCSCCKQARKSEVRAFALDI